MKIENSNEGGSIESLRHFWLGIYSLFSFIGLVIIFMNTLDLKSPGFTFVLMLTIFGSSLIVSVTNVILSIKRRKAGIERKLNILGLILSIIVLLICLVISFLFIPVWLFPTTE